MAKVSVFLVRLKANKRRRHINVFFLNENILIFLSPNFFLRMTVPDGPARSPVGTSRCYRSPAASIVHHLYLQLSSQFIGTVNSPLKRNKLKEKRTHLVQGLEAGDRDGWKVEKRRGKTEKSLLAFDEGVNYHGNKQTKSL